VIGVSNLSLAWSSAHVPVHSWNTIFDLCSFHFEEGLSLEGFLLNLLFYFCSMKLC
jgi:hypothetical protein